MSSEGAIEAEVVQNTAPPWERVAPACVDTLNLGCLLHLGTLAAVLPLWCNPRLGAAGATRSQGGRRIGSLKRERSCVAKPGFERGCNQLALLMLWSQQRKAPTLGAEFSDCTVYRCSVPNAPTTPFGPSRPQELEKHVFNIDVPMP